MVVVFTLLASLMAGVTWLVCTTWENIERLWAQWQESRSGSPRD